MSSDTKTIEVTKPEEKNSKGMPEAHFIENVEEFCRKTNGGVSDVLKELHTLYGKYKVLETSLMQQKKALVTKIPQMKAAIKALAFLLKKQEGDEDTLTTHFELSDNVYAQAEIDASNDKVCLWLGANVMLEYTYEEAHALLTKNLANSKISLGSLNKDLGFLKDQITISEVNIARCHNYNVVQNQDKAKEIKKNGQ